MFTEHSISLRRVIQVAFAACVVTAIAPSSSDAQLGPGPVWSKLNRRCVDVPSANTADGTRIIMWDCNGGTGQQLTYTAAGELRVLNKCLTTNGTQGNFIELWSCTGYAGQKWTYQPGTGTFKGMNGLCMVISGANAAVGANLIAYACAGGQQDNQTWSLPSGRFSQYNAFMTDDGRCIWGTTSSVGVGTCTMDYSVWTAFYDPENFFLLRHVDANGVTNCIITGSKATPARLGACDRNNPAERFYFNTSGQMQIVGTNLCLDVSGGQRLVSNQVVSWDCDLNANLAARTWNQKFALALLVPTWQVQAAGVSVPSSLGGTESLVGKAQASQGRAVSTIVAAGGGNIVAGGGGNIVAGGGGNIVAGGGGNLAPRNPVAGGGASIVAAGGGNIIAAGGGNIIAAAGVAMKP